MSPRKQTFSRGPRDKMTLSNSFLIIDKPMKRPAIDEDEYSLD
jgi:hypothetical protein